MLGAGKANTHEFWIDPVEYAIAADDQITARLRVGQLFEGPKTRYFPSWITLFEVFHQGKPTEVTARLGDDPALFMPALGDGLLVVAYESSDSTVTYGEWQKFEEFLTHKGYADLLTLHETRGLPRKAFAEIYRRYAKSLIAAGSGQGADFATGHRLEIVALANPYTDDLSGGLPVRVLFEGAPRADAQVELFARQPDGVVSTAMFRTGTDGVAVLPVLTGVEYLVDHVVVLPLPNDDPKAGPVWQSLWASLTFKVVRQ